MTDTQLSELYHAARNAVSFKQFKGAAADVLSASIADTAKPVIDKSMVKRLMVQYGLDKSQASIADTAGSMPVQVFPQDVMGIPPNPPSSASMTIRHDVPTRNAPSKS